MVWRTALAVTGGVVGTALIAWPVALWWEVKKLERPKYKVVKVLGTQKSWIGKPLVELREYEPYLVAEVTVPAKDTMKQTMGEGFKQVAGYIFGKNTSRESDASESIAMTSPVRCEMAKGEQISMTSPVGSEMGADGVYRISFMMPSKYSKDTLPLPKNPAVTIKTVAARLTASISFNQGLLPGLPSEATVELKRKELLDIIKEEGLVAQGDPMLYQYHPPFAPGFIRENEVLYNVEGAPK